jgi:hypothetical protein
MLKSIFGITVIAECCCLIAAIFLLSKKTEKWRLFIPFLFITVFADIAGSYLHFVSQSTAFTFIYNALLIISISYLLWFYSLSEPLEKLKFHLNYLIIFFNVFAISNLFFLQGFWSYNDFTEVLGDIMIVIVSSIFYYKLLVEEMPRKLFRYSYFWLSAGLLLFYLGSIILYLFHPVIKEYYQETCINIGGTINDILNLLLFASFIISFVCQRNIKSL